ncbi:MAG TPA: hypothetical protein VHA09_08685 [Nitrososphaera sp.]|nr:hypothetical protein [Nitrososphaera sp.]
MTPEHGELDAQTQQKKWFCGYWMTQEEWEDIHDYAPPNTGAGGRKGEEQEQQGQEENDGEEEE